VEANEFNGKKDFLKRVLLGGVDGDVFKIKKVEKGEKNLKIMCKKANERKICAKN
jgi:hypothetical protein